ncbi:hypothetical protein PGH45_04350 [Legionella pneumophila]|nr:hypothetical protein [Legionella pneumophila]
MDVGQKIRILKRYLKEKSVTPEDVNLNDQDQPMPGWIRYWIIFLYITMDCLTSQHWNLMKSSGNNMWIYLTIPQPTHQALPCFNRYQ